MTKRYKYGLNAQWHNAGLMNRQYPMGYIEVVPGDTISGQVNYRVMSAPTKTLIFNRGYHDVSAYYIPFRLLDPNFVQMVTKRDGTTTPNVLSTFVQNYEFSDNAHCAYQRHAYNMIHNKFFRIARNPEIDLNTVGLQRATYRPTTFHEAEPEVDYVDTTIDTSGPTLTVDELRQAFNEDRFAKVRQFYGDRYVDYLAALGVKTNWTILDEPELIGRKNGTMKYNIIDPTAADTSGVSGDFPVGKPGGYFTHESTFKLKKTFCPEHGLIVLISSVKMDQQYTLAELPMLHHSNHEDFWSPEMDSMAEKRYNRELWLGEALGAGNIGMAQWEHLRRHSNQSADTNADQDLYIHTFAALDEVDFKSLDTTAFQDLFQDVIGEINGAPAQVVIVADHQLVKVSPVGQRTTNPIR